MGVQHRATEMKAFMCISALVAATSAQLIGHHVGHVGHAVGYGGGQTSHVSVSKPFGSPIASHSSHDSVANTAAHGVAAHLGQGAVHGVHHGVGHAVVGPAYHAAPVVHAAPAY